MSEFNPFDADSYPDEHAAWEQTDQDESGTAEKPDGPALDRGWLPQDLGAFLDGEMTVVEPELMPRDDGVHLLYRGMVNEFHGESESGKSLIAQAEAARILLGGGAVAYVDFEADVANVGGRMLAMGVPRDVLKARFTYIHPEDSYESTNEARAAFEQLLSRRLDLVVVDGVTESLTMFRLSGRDEGDFAAWFAKLPKRIAKQTGAAVLLIDHVVKNQENRGRFAIGSEHKMAALTGAGYRIDLKQTLGQGLKGALEMWIVKDRHGQIRPHCGPRRPDRSQHAANVVIDSTDGETIKVTVQAPTSTLDAPGEPEKPFRPTAIMEKVSRFLEQMPEASANAIESDINAKRDTVRLAVRLLAEEGYLARTRQGSGFRHWMLRPYIEKHDPGSDRYRGPTT